MKLNMYMYRNIVAGCFTTPIYDDHSVDDFVTSLERGIRVACADQDPAAKLKVVQFKQLELFHFGVFDDTNGLFDLLDHPVLVFSPHDLVTQLEVAGGNVNG